MPSAPAITPQSMKQAEAALVKATKVRDADRDRAAESERAFRAQCLDSSLAGVTYTRINVVTGLSKSRIDQLLRAERETRQGRKHKK